MSEILVVDDDPSILKLLRRILQREGFCVKTTQSGRSALYLMKEKMPDLAVVDMLMPSVNGIDLIMALKKENSRMKIIAISGGDVYDSQVYLELAFTLGANRILSKPISSKKLIQTINELI